MRTIKKIKLSLKKIWQRTANFKFASKTLPLKYEFLLHSSLGCALLNQAQKDNMHYKDFEHIDHPDDLAEYRSPILGILRPRIGLFKHSDAGDLIHEVGHHNQAKKLGFWIFNPLNREESLIINHVLESDQTAQTAIVLIQSLIYARRIGNEELAKKLEKAAKKTGLNKADLRDAAKYIDSKACKQLARRIFDEKMNECWSWEENEEYLKEFSLNKTSQEKISNKFFLLKCGGSLGAFTMFLLLPINPIISVTMGILSGLLGAEAIISTISASLYHVPFCPENIKIVYRRVGELADGSGNYLLETEGFSADELAYMDVPRKFRKRLDVMRDLARKHYGIRALKVAQSTLKFIPPPH